MQIYILSGGICFKIMLSTVDSNDAAYLNCSWQRKKKKQNKMKRISCQEQETT